MADYRVYCIDGAGKITNAHDIPAQIDGEALAIARGMKVTSGCYLWEVDG